MDTIQGLEDFRFRLKVVCREERITDKRILLSWDLTNAVLKHNMSFVDDEINKHEDKILIRKLCFIAFHPASSKMRKINK